MVIAEVDEEKGRFDSAFSPINMMFQSVVKLKHGKTERSLLKFDQLIGVIAPSSRNYKQ